jgi:hypothetical protein
VALARLEVELKVDVADRVETDRMEERDRVAIPAGW